MPGQLFTQPKPESCPSVSVATASVSTSATTNETWKFLNSLTLDNQPKATLVNLFPSSGVQASAAAAPSTYTSTSSATAAASASSLAPAASHTDYPTVNMADLPGLAFGAFSSNQGMLGGVNQDPSSSSFGVTSVVQSSQFKVEEELELGEELEFPSFSEERSGLDSINIEDFQSLLAEASQHPAGIIGVGVAGAQQASSCHMPSTMPCGDGGCGGTTMVNLASQVESAIGHHMGNGGIGISNAPSSGAPSATLMDYPESLAMLLHSNDYSAGTGSPMGSHGPNLDLDMMDSTDEERIMSIFPGFMSTNPT